MCPWASLRFVVATSEGLSKASIVGAHMGFVRAGDRPRGVLRPARTNWSAGQRGHREQRRESHRPQPLQSINAISYPLNPLAVTVRTALLLGQGVAGGGVDNGETYLGVPKAEVRLRQRGETFATSFSNGPGERRSEQRTGAEHLPSLSAAGDDHPAEVLCPKTPRHRHSRENGRPRAGSIRVDPGPRRAAVASRPWSASRAARGRAPRPRGSPPTG